MSHATWRWPHHSLEIDGFFADALLSGHGLLYEAMEELRDHLCFQVNDLLNTDVPVPAAQAACARNLHERGRTRHGMERSG